MALKPTYKTEVGNNKQKRATTTRHNNGEIITDEDRIKEIWEQYIMQLFDDERENK